MYSIDLDRFTIEEFHEILLSIDLLPGRRILLDNRVRIFNELKIREISSLGDLQKFLKKKADYHLLSKELSVEKEYLIVLNREINSYVSKPLPLEKLDTFSNQEIAALALNGIRNTKELYESCSKREKRKKVASNLKLSESKIILALQLIDLLRVNGIGPVYAKILNEIGIKSKDEYLLLGSEEIVNMVHEVNKQKEFTKVRLGIKDVEYCKRFCKKLDSDIDW